MNIFKNKVFQLILFISFGVGLLYLVYINQRNDYLATCIANNGIEANCDYLEKIISDLSNAKISWILISLALFTLSNISRALRWNLLFKSMSYTVNFWNSFFAVMIGYMINLGLPRAGEVAKIAVISRNENIPIQEVTGTLVVDRSMDFICLIIIILLGIFFEYEILINFLQKNGSFPFWIFYLMIFPIAGLIWFLSIRKTSEIGFIKKVNTLFEGFSIGVMSVFRMKQKALFLFHSVIIWFCYYLMTYVIFFAYEPTENLGPVSGLVVFIFGALGMVVPSPGGAGSYHYLIAKGLEIYGDMDGFVLANIIFIPMQLCNVALGLLGYFLLPILKKDDKVEI